MASAKVLLDAFDLLLRLIAGAVSCIEVVFIFNCLRVNYLIAPDSFFAIFSKYVTVSRVKTVRVICFSLILPIFIVLVDFVLFIVIIVRGRELVVDCFCGPCDHYTVRYGLKAF